MNKIKTGYKKEINKSVQFSWCSDIYLRIHTNFLLSGSSQCLLNLDLIDCVGGHHVSLDKKRQANPPSLQRWPKVSGWAGDEQIGGDGQQRRSIVCFNQVRLGSSHTFQLTVN